MAETDSQLFHLMSARWLITIMNKAMWTVEQLCCQQILGVSQRGLWRCTRWCRRRVSQAKSAHPRSGPLLGMSMSNICFSSFACCVLRVGKLVIHQQMGSGTVSREGLVSCSSGMNILIAELKSTNCILALVCRLSSCYRIKCRPMLTTSCTDLFPLQANCSDSNNGQVITCL